MNKRKYILSAIILSLFVSMSSTGQVLRKQGFTLGGRPVVRPTSNFINDVYLHGLKLMAGTGDGLLVTADRGESWVLFDQEFGLGKGGVSAIASQGDTVWVATAYDTTTDLGDYEAGGGLSWSPDNGETWNWIPQPLDNAEETSYRPTTTNIQNITYDIAIAGSAVWITSFGGGLRKSTDNGQTWEVVTVDNNPFDSLNKLTHRVFSVYFDGEAIWVGSAGGIHKTLDQGATWRTFNHTQENGISGNFVVAIGHQDLPYGKRIWAATIEALDETEVRAVSYTDDGGLTWQHVLEGEFVHNFGFDPVSGAVYAASDRGLYKSMDGEHWGLFPSIRDDVSGAVFLTEEMNAAAVEPDQTLWAGSSDGLAVTTDDGYSWKIHRAYQPAGVDGEPDTYAFPNPFSPMRHNRVNDDGFVRFHFLTKKDGDITVRVFDFAMELVCKVAEDRYLSAGDHDITWNGRNDLGDFVANACYFYRIEREGQADLWGKVLILN